MLDRDLDETQPVHEAYQCRKPMTKCSHAHRLRSVRSAVPGRALRLSAAPPTTIVMDCPAPRRRIFEQDSLLTEQMPIARRISRYNGKWKLEVSVRRCGLIPGNAFENPVAAGVVVLVLEDGSMSAIAPSVANVHVAPL